MKPCQCKNEHQQLAEWLVELRYRREKDYIPKKEPDRKELRKPYLSCSGHIVDPDADERFSQM